MNDLDYISVIERSHRVRIAVAKDQTVVLDDNEPGIDSQ